MADQNRDALITELLQAGWVQFATWSEEVTSTNDVAKSHLVSGGATPALFVADKQTLGRGRMQRVWWSPSGCLMLTLAISQQHMPDDRSLWQQLALVVGVAAAETVSEVLDERSLLAPKCQLKWPNDVYVGERKVAGILIEARKCATSGKMQWLIGIGMNVDMDWSDAPAEIADKACCLASVCDVAPSREMVLLGLCQQLQSWLSRWCEGDAQWLDYWANRCLLSGKIVRFKNLADAADQAILVARCEGIDAAGNLIVRDHSGTRLLASAEILSWN